eukprot:scaffold468644_cov40-Prasinocladus_malaysianus.AAC.1
MDGGREGGTVERKQTDILVDRQTDRETDRHTDIRPSIEGGGAGEYPPASPGSHLPDDQEDGRRAGARQLIQKHRKAPAKRSRQPQGQSAQEPPPSPTEDCGGAAGGAIGQQAIVHAPRQ